MSNYLSKLVQEDLAKHKRFIETYGGTFFYERYNVQAAKDLYENYRQLLNKFEMLAQDLASRSEPHITLQAGEPLK